MLCDSTSFQPFTAIFGDFMPKINKKRLKMNKVKNQLKKDKFEALPQGVDQHLHVNQLWGVNKYHFFFVNFQMFFVDFRPEITEKGLKRKKKLRTTEKSSSTSFQVLQALTNTQHFLSSIVRVKVDSPIKQTYCLRQLCWLKLLMFFKKDILRSSRRFQ